MLGMQTLMIRKVPRIVKDRRTHEIALFVGFSLFKRVE